MPFAFRMSQTGTSMALIAKAVYLNEASCDDIWYSQMK